MPDPVLTLLKYVFLAILYLFFLRVLRAVWVETREPKPAPPPPRSTVASTPSAGPRAATSASSTGGPAAGPAAPATAGAPLGPGALPTAGPARPGSAGLNRSPMGPEKLVILEPESMKGQEFLLGSEVTVGRAGGCAVLLADDTFVSQLHARLFRRDREILVEDSGSTNGTFLNGRKVSAPVAIRKGDRIQFGRTTVEVRK